MMIIAQWRNMRWEVSREIVTALTSLSTSRKLKSERNNDRDGSNPTNVKGYEPQSIPISYDVSDVMGVDPRAEYETWVRLAGKTGGLLLGGKRFGPRRLMLDEVSLDISQFSENGDIRIGTISLSFTQDDGGVTSSSPPAPAIRTGSSAVSTSALKVGPSAEEKRRMKG